MSVDGTRGSISDSLVRGITDHAVAGKSGEELVAATIRLDKLDKHQVQKVLKVLEPYEDSMEVVTRKDLVSLDGDASVAWPHTEALSDMDLSLDTSANAPRLSLDGLGGVMDTTQDLGGTPSAPTVNGNIPSLRFNQVSGDVGGIATVPSATLTGPIFDTDLGGSLTSPDASLSTPGASVNIDKPNINTSNYKAPKFEMPHFNLAQVQIPKADLAEPEGIPSVNGNIDMSNFKLSAPHGGINGTDTECKNPAIDLSAPGINLDSDVDVNLPKADLKTPDLDIKSADVDINKPSGKIVWPHEKWGKLKLHRPKGDLDLDAKLNTPNVDVSAPKVKGDIDVPRVDASHGLHWPHTKWKKPKIHQPKADLDVNADVNTPNINMSTSKIEGDINGPSAEFNLPNLNSPHLDANAPNINVQSPSGKIQWPHRKWKKPKLRGPAADLDADLNAPDVDVSIPNVDANMNVPDVDLPEAPSGKIKFPTLKKPNFSLFGPKVATPDVDLQASGKAPDLSATFKKPEADFNLPQADIDVKTPSADIKGPNVKWPTLKKPKWSLSGPKVNGPDMNADLSTPNIDLPDANLNLPNAELNGLNVNAPDLDVNAPDIDVDAPSGKFKWLNIKKPSFGTLKVPKADLDADLSAPKIDGGLDVDMPDTELNGLNVNTPDLDVNAPDIDMEAPSGKFKWLNIKKPSFGTLKVPKADLDADLSAPKIDGGLDVDMPDADFKGPSADLDGPDMNLEASDWKFSKLKLPKLKVPKVKGPELDTNIKAPDIGAGLDIPKVEFDSRVSDLKTPHLSLPEPKIGSSLDTPDLDVNLPGGGVDLPSPDVSGGKLKLPKMKMPKFGFSGMKVKEPNIDVDANLKRPDLTVDTKMPNADLTAPGLSVKSPGLNTSTPNLDAGIGLPGLNLEKPDAQGPSVNLPKAPNTDTNLPQANLRAPDVTTTSPNLHMNLPKAPDIDLGDSKLPYFKIPNALSGPDVDTSIEAPKVSMDTLSANTNIPTPHVDVKTPGLDVNGPDADVSLDKPKKSHFKFPTFGLKRSKSKSLDVESDSNQEDGNGVDNDVSYSELEVPAFKFHTLPRNSIDVFGGLADAFDISSQNSEEKDYMVSKGLRLPILNATHKDGEKIDILERLRVAKEKTPSANVTPTEDKHEIDLKLRPSSLDSSLVRGGTFKVEKPEGTLSFDAPEISTANESDKFSQGLSNMLVLN